MQSVTYHLFGQHVEIPPRYQHLIRIKTREAIADEHGVSVRTMRMWLRSKCPEIPKNKLLSPNDVLFIYLTIGWPPMG